MLESLIKFYDRNRINKVLLSVAYAFLCALLTIPLFMLLEKLTLSVDATATLAAIFSIIFYVVVFVFGVRFFNDSYLEYINPSN